VYSRGAVWAPQGKKSHAVKKNKKVQNTFGKTPPRLAEAALGAAEEKKKTEKGAGFQQEKPGKRIGVGGKD